MILSKKSIYGLKALLSLARRDSKDLVIISDLAREENIPKKFLEAILLALKNGGILHSRIGKGGGYSLAVPARELTVGRIIRILEGDYAPLACLNATNYSQCTDCNDMESCGIRLVMSDVHRALISVLDSALLSGMVERSDAIKNECNHIVDYSI
jgi:Rrf2 family protein